MNPDDKVFDRCFFCRGEGYFPQKKPHICPGCRSNYKLMALLPPPTVWERLLEEDGL